jgi:hypothetical protein
MHSVPLIEALCEYQTTVSVQESGVYPLHTFMPGTAARLWLQ